MQCSPDFEPRNRNMKRSFLRGHDENYLITIDYGSDTDIDMDWTPISETPNTVGGPSVGSQEAEPGVTIKDNAGGSTNDDSEQPSSDRPDLMVSLASSDKSPETRTHDMEDDDTEGVPTIIEKKFLAEKIVNLKTPSERVNFIKTTVSESLPASLNDLQQDHLDRLARAWAFKTVAKYQKCARRMSFFLDKEKQYLDGYFVLPKNFFPSERTKRRRVEELEKSLSPEDPGDLVHAVSRTLNKHGHPEAARIIKKSLSPSKQQVILDSLSKPSTTPTPYTAEEALSLILDLGLTQTQYQRLREGANQHGCPLYPSYHEVQKCKISSRPPADELCVTESSASIPLNSLLQHTASRIVNMQNSVLLQIFASQHICEIKATLICSWGFDGSSGQSRYKQKSSTSFDDSSIFATTLTPIRLTAANGTVIWNNSSPQSIRFCRPLHLQYIKESQEKILNEQKYVEDQIAVLDPIEVFVDLGKTITINFDLRFTVIDGKVLSAICGVKSSMCCPICEAKPSTFNSIENIGKGLFTPKPGRLNHGISPLHAWIRLLELCLHIAYRLDIQKWQARGPVLQASVKKRKEEIQQLLLKEMGLRVDFPNNTGSGTSNDGNTARRAFRNYEEFAKLTGLDVEFVRRLWVILVALTCQLPLNADKFGEYCFNVVQYYLTLYQWFPMPASMHKILIHGKDIINSSIIPLGCLGEEGGESRNKMYKSDRLRHSRKISRTATMTDIFNRAMDTSDPLLSSLHLDKRARYRKQLALPQEVLHMLECPSVPTTQEFGDDDQQVEPDENSLDYENEIELENEYLPGMDIMGNNRDIENT
ncbi:hypothetical protein Fcan01_18208 [Folsomia candida]|uniref:Uncharacterized protein n=1 Tax=Folsomia candida TaxID=158441 RepID=A0A226DPP4_FOLCA|nr:hypothetical protein Fcan01_18193 [Folsomia candida]OXA46988.1 hypothetical protein Fcan01_18208 [Folsomia candida]